MPKEIIDGITDAIGGIFENPVIQLGLQAAAVYIVILWLAAAYWAFRDMQLRTDNPILPYLAASLIIIFTPIFFPFAAFAYKVVRPQEKIGETYERTLAEEALLAEVEAIKTCPTCTRRVHEEWIICPTCRTRLNRVCPNCSRLVGLDWSLCAWCGKDFERREFAAVEPLPDLEDTGRLARGGERARAAVRAATPRSMARPTSRPAAAQDPLPER
jgi:RNA polymerase subunit RPABC4/transcription elongation factor Spt4